MAGVGEGADAVVAARRLAVHARASIQTRVALALVYIDARTSRSPGTARTPTHCALYLPNDDQIARALSPPPPQMKHALRLHMMIDNDGVIDNDGAIVKGEETREARLGYVAHS